MIGVGSNLLVRDGGVPGVVIRLGRGFSEIEAEPGNRVRVGTAVPDVRVARFAYDNRIEGLTFLRGIPGTIGGALRMNGGAYGGETKDVLIEAHAVDRSGEHARAVKCARCNILTGIAVRRRIDFHRGPAAGAGGTAAKIILAAMDKITDSREATQPIRAAPVVQPSRIRPAHKSWQLIDKAGMRGFAIGPAKVSELHCNFLINEGGATAAQIEELGETIRARVKASSGIELDWEIKRIGIPAGAA